MRARTVSMAAGVPDVPRPRDAFIIFSKSRVAEAKLAFALKGELEQLGLFAFEYEHWNWFLPASPDDDADEVDRQAIRSMFDACSTIVLITPVSGDASRGAQLEMEELRGRDIPILLVHWSPEGWSPILEPERFEEMNIVWNQQASSERDGDVRQNHAEHVGRQVAHAAWLVVKLRALYAKHPKTAGLLLSSISHSFDEGLLSFRLRHEETSPEQYVEHDRAMEVAQRVAHDAPLADAESFVREWRSGLDLIAESVAKSAKFELGRTLHGFFDDCEALCQACEARLPALEDMLKSVALERGTVCVRLGREEEAVEVLQRAMRTAAPDTLWQFHQALGLARCVSDMPSAVESFTRAMEHAPNASIRCGLTYDRGAVRIEMGDAGLEQAVADFSVVIDHADSTEMHHAALRGRARALAALGRHDQAIDDYSSILEDPSATPRHAVSAWMDRGWLYQVVGRVADAIVDWTEPRQRFLALQARGEAYEKHEEHTRAADDFEAMSRFTAIAREYRDELRTRVAALRARA